MALLLKEAHASESEDFESGPKIVKFVVVKKHEEEHAQPAELTSFEEVILPHLDAAHNLARWLLRNEQDAQDVVQEAYLRAFKSFAGFHGSNGRAWLLTIVRNTSYTLLKKNRAVDLTTTFDEEIHAADYESVSPATILEMISAVVSWLAYTTAFAIASARHAAAMMRRTDPNRSNRGPIAAANARALTSAHATRPRLASDNRPSSANPPKSTG